jgi:hypothetical protein
MTTTLHIGSDCGRYCKPDRVTVIINIPNKPSMSSKHATKMLARIKRIGPGILLAVITDSNKRQYVIKVGVRNKREMKRL